MAKYAYILSMVHDERCCASCAIDFEHMALLRHDINSLIICSRSVRARCCKCHLDIALKFTIV